MGINAQYIRNLMHGQPTVMSMVVANTQTIVVGDLVCIVAGLITKVIDTAHTLIVGIAMEAITTTTHAATDIIDVLLLDEYSVIRLPCTGTDSVEANNFTTAYDVDSDQQVNFADTDAGFLFPVALPDAVKSGYVDVTIKASALWNA